MTFQFLCPQGHLLAGEESHQGQPCDCPTCGTRFIIPAPHGAAPAPGPPPSQPSGPAFPDVTGPATGGAPSFTMEPQGPKLYHIPCPKGHELETPEEMLGQAVLCPLCGEQFTLKHKNSREYKELQEKERARKDRQIDKAWFNRAIVAAVVVILGLIVLMVITASS